MNYIKVSCVTFIFALFMVGCQDAQEKKHHQSEQETQRSPLRASIVKKDSLSTAETVKLAEAQFRKHLPKKLANNDAYIDSQDTFTGDFTGDGIADIAIYFSLAPNEGGNTIVAQGLTLYQNNGKAVKLIAEYDPNYLFSFIKIERGKIYIEKLEYADTDARCCPSLKTEHTLTLSGNRAY